MSSQLNDRRARLTAMISSDPQRLRRRSISLGVHPADADDVAQTAALRAWRSVDTLRSADEGRLCAWLDVIARNAVIDLNRSRRMTLVRLDDAIPDSADTENDVATRIALDEALSRINGLPDTLRVPFLLNVVEGRSADDIAVTLGLTPVAVRQRISRARRAVAPRLETARAS